MKRGKWSVEIASVGIKVTVHLQWLAYLQPPNGSMRGVSFINCTPASIFRGGQMLSAERGKKTVTFARLPFIPTSPHCVNF